MANQDQLDELECLQAIYDGSEDVVLRVPDLSPESVEVRAGLENPDLDLEVLVAIHSESTSRAELNWGYKELSLRLRLPPEYLAAGAPEPALPIFEVSSCSLSRHQLSLLCEELDRQGVEHADGTIIFAWLEWLRLEAWTFLLTTDEVALADSDGQDSSQASDPRVTARETNLKLQCRQELLPSTVEKACANCSAAVSDEAGICLSTCKHTLCSKCVSAALQIHSACGAAACCPLPECRKALPAEIQESMGCFELWAGVSRHVLGTPFQDVLVFCPRCEDRGMDMPVITTSFSRSELDEAIESDDFESLVSSSRPCNCYTCDLSFCGLCRSPCHPGESCFSEPSRAVRMSKRRPPLTPELAEVAAKLADAVNKSERLKALELAAFMKTLNNDFDRLRETFRSMHVEKIMTGLEGVLGGPITLTAAPVARDVQERFMTSMQNAPDTEFRPAFHGTNAANHSSIFERGLLIPGQGNDLRVVHGAAHGTGVYTANVDAAWLSKGFCSDPSMLVCAVLQIDVHHVGDAMVVRNADHVIPLFEASGQHFGNGTPPIPKPVVMKPSAAKVPVVQPVAAASSKTSPKVKGTARAKGKIPKDKSSKFKARIASLSQRH